jgi:uncharacterized Zn-finger protein
MTEHEHCWHPAPKQNTKVVCCYCGMKVARAADDNLVVAKIDVTSNDHGIYCPNKGE